MGIGKIARRGFLIGSGAIAGGAVFGFYKYSQAYPNPVKGALTPYVVIDGDGVTIIAPRAEMGQGIHTTLAAMVAEELDVAWEDVRVVHGPASKAYYNVAMLAEGIPFPTTDHGWMAETARGAMAVPAKFLGLQVTGGSSSTPDGFDKMRKAGAAARLALIGAAAQQLGVSVSSLSTQNGAVIAPDGSRIPYADLAEAALDSDLPDDPPLKPRSQWRYLGQNMPRVDVLTKSTGTASFASDIRLPTMIYASTRMNPGRDGPLNGFDASEAQAMRGVLDVVEMPKGGVAVLADNTWRAMQALDAITYDWGTSPYPATSDAIMDAIHTAFDGDSDSSFRNDGDAAATLDAADTVIEAEYSAPMLAHQTMEPMSAVAWLRDGVLDLWVGTQAPTSARSVAAKLAGIEESAVTVHVTYLGGGFGRRAESDFVEQAVFLATKTEGRPVKLIWSREEDTKQGFYRPPAIARMRGAVSGERITALDAAVSSPSVIEAMMGRMGIPAAGPDKLLVDGLFDQPYDIADYRARGFRAPMIAPITSWRSVGNSFNGFFHECFLDELAHKAGADHLALRLSMMSHAPSRGVLEAVGEMSDWDKPLGEGRGKGLAYHLSFGVPTAQVVEVSVTAEGDIRLEGAWAAVDVGIALDPRNIEAQVQSGMLFGLGAAMNGEITVADGAIEQSNFHDADALRMDKAPPVAVRVLEAGEKVRGIGEPGTPPAAPALANAIFAATGQRIRDLPLNKAVTFA